MVTTTAKNKEVPELRFKGFASNWKMVSLLSLSPDGFSNGVFNDPAKVGSGYKLINVKDMYSGEVIDVEKLTLVELEKAKFEKNKALAGDIFFTRSSLVKEGIAHSNLLAIEGEDITYDGHLIRLRPNKEVVNPKFLARVLKTPSVRKQLIARGKTATMTTIGQNDIASVSVQIADMPEQQKIADFIGSVDAWLDNLRQQKTALETYKRGMMQKLFTQQVRFKDDNGKNYPDWASKELGKVFNAVKGNGISKDELDVDGVNECILYGELYTTYNEVVFEVKSKTHVSDGTRSKIGDLLIPCSTTTTAIDLANVTALNKENVLLGGDITILRGKEEVSNIFYAYYLSNHKKTDLAKYGQGVTIIHIYYSHFKDMIIEVPSLSEQQKIADFLTAIDETITAKAEEIAKVEQWKKGLMQKMFI